MIRNSKQAGTKKPDDIQNSANVVMPTETSEATTNSVVPTKCVTKSPLISLEIDRIALDKAGVDQHAVDRIYKGLFSGSMGMYDTFRTTL